ncbi:MAG: DUF1837 domain-containing protein [Alphaproteobacteria bacterium]|nr:DUF1837 domain-containing protein [Alphaproteobacteria bacterium]
MNDSIYSDKPDSFLVHFHQFDEKDIKRCVDGLDAGFERDKWRGEALASHLLEWLPEFALSETELKEFKSNTWLPKVQKAVARIYTTEKALGQRGEIGELLLHIAIRQIYSSEPVVCKVFYKTSANDTIKGWDGAHFVKNSNSEYELWLGEAKFYTNPKDAFRSAYASLKQHLEASFLKPEREIILTLSNSGGFSIPERISHLLHRNTSLDEVMQNICIPIFISYESDALKKYDVSNYIEEIKSEVKSLYDDFMSSIKGEYNELHLRIILFPMHSKEVLVQAFDEKIKGLQKL